MHPTELWNEEHARFMKELYAAIIDRRRDFSPDIELGYQLSEGPMYVVKDYGISGMVKKILAIGGRVDSPKQEDGLLGRLLQVGVGIIGLAQEEPLRLNAIGHINPDYFPQGSEARKFMEKSGYGSCFKD